MVSFCSISSFLLALSLLVPGASAFGVENQAADTSLNALLKPVGLSFDEAGGFVVAKDIQRKGQKMSFQTVIATKKGERFEIELIQPLEEAEAAPLVKKHYEQIESLYSPRATPYHGAVTNLTACPEDRKPVTRTAKILGKDVKVLLANATDRYTFGVWDDASIHQRAAVASFYLPARRTLVHVKAFQASKGFSEAQALKLLSSIREN